MKDTSNKAPIYTPEQKKKIERVKWVGTDPEGNDIDASDNHTHEFQYEGSDMLSSSKVRSLQNKTQAAVASQIPRGANRTNVTKDEPEVPADVTLEDVSTDND